MKAVKEIVRKYYKYSETISVPSFSSASEAETGVNEVSLSNTALYNIFGRTDYGNHYLFYGSTVSTIIDLGGLSLLQGFSYKSWGQTNVAYDTSLLSIEASQDNKNWTTVYTGDATSKMNLSEDYADQNTPYRYLKPTFRHYPAEESQVPAGISYFNTTFKRAIESTQQDYDFYKDVPIYKLIYSGKEQVPYSIEYNNNVIPAMTSNTEPYNTVTIISGSLYSSGSQWRGFGNPSAGIIEPSSNSATIRYSFETPIPQGDYNLIFWYSSDTPKYGTATYQNRKLYSYSVTLNYSDNTTEIVSSWNGTLTNTYKFVDYFKAGKEIKSIDFAFTGDASGENLVLGCIYDIQLYEGEIIYKELDTYKAPRSWEKGQYYGN